MKEAHLIYNGVLKVYVFYDSRTKSDHFRTEFWHPKLLNRDVLDVWKKKGAKQLSDKLDEKVKEILKNHKPVPLSEEAIGRMQEILDS